MGSVLLVSDLQMPDFLHSGRKRVYVCENILRE